VPSANILVSLIKKIQSEISALLANAQSWEHAQPVLRALLDEIERVWTVPAEPAEGGLRGALEREKQDVAATLEKLEEEFSRISKGAEAARVARERAHEALRQVLLELDEKRSALAEKHGILQEYRLEGEKRRLQEEDLAAKIREAGFEYEEFVASHREVPAPDIGAPQEVESRIVRLRRELADIGSVDEELVREYHDAETRHSFLAAQKADLERALADLQTLQKELEKKIDQEFSAALKGISEQFQHYFRLLFGGGSARLAEYRPKLKTLEHAEEGAVLEGREDELAVQEMPEPEAGGIAVDVSLPRKKVKSLDMLSGGERALTAIALIFAVVNVSSPPFLVLDEIDAPLDEANSERFGRLLRELADQTQFILITHNRVTMEAADVLYGVTMQDGVSKLFSLKFEEAEQIAAKDVHPVRLQ
jgi:chromosome segregation protein